MARDSIRLWKSYIDAGRLLPDAERLAYYDAIFDYGIYEEQPELTGVVAAMFTLAKPTLDSGLAKQDAGKKGGAVSRPKADAKQSESKSEADESNPEPIREKRIENREERIENNTPYIPLEGESVTTQEHTDEEFEAFWSLYPKKKSKGDAKKAWKKLKPSATTVSTIMAKLHELINSNDWKRDNGQFIPYPATWLRAEGWNDEVSSPVAPRPFVFDYGSDDGYIGL